MPNTTLKTTASTMTRIEPTNILINHIAELKIKNYLCFYHGTVVLGCIKACSLYISLTHIIQVYKNYKTRKHHPMEKVRQMHEAE